jgi:hypothetical protein
MKLFIIKSVKFISPLVMLGAIFFDGNFIYLALNHQDIPKLFTALFILGTMIIIIHGIEAFVAGYLAKDKEDKNPILYGIYTFLTGTIALYELLEPDTQE